MQSQKKNREDRQGNEKKEKRSNTISKDLRKEKEKKLNE